MSKPGVRNKLCPSCSSLARKHELRKCNECGKVRCPQCNSLNKEGICRRCISTMYPPREKPKEGK